MLTWTGTGGRGQVVFEILGFTAAGEEEEKANVLIWTRPGAAPLAEGDVLRAGRSTLSGLPSSGQAASS